MKWGSTVLCGSVAITGVAVALIPTQTLAAFLTHPLRAERAGVAVREVTLEGAALLRIAGALMALAWVGLPLLIGRLASSGAPSASALSLGRRWSTAMWLAIALGVALRLARFTESLWYDEISALLDYAQYGAGATIGTYFVQSNHVLHTLLTAWMIELADGVSEPILRTPALLAGLGSIPALWWLGREVSRGDADAGSPLAPLPYLCAGAAALMPIMVLESVEARGYSLMILFAALSSAALLRGIRTGGCLAFLGYALFAALGVWTHLVFVALPLGHAIVLATRMRKANSLAGLLAICLAAITAFTLLSPLIPELVHHQSEFRALDGDEPTLFSREGLGVLLGLSGSWWWDAVFWLPLVLLGIAGVLLDRARRIPLALTLAGLPILIVLVTLGGSWMYARFAVFALPGAILAGACGISDIVRGRTKAPNSARMPYGLLMAGSVVAFAWIDKVLDLPPKQPIRDAVAYIDARADESAVVAAAGLHDNIAAYYGVIADRTIDNAGYGGRGIATLTREPEWLIVLYPHALDPALTRDLENRWTLEASFDGWVDWGKGDVRVYRRALGLPLNP